MILQKEIVISTDTLPNALVTLTRTFKIGEIDIPCKADVIVCY